MKRFLTLGVLALFSFFAKADTDISSFSSCIYPTACTGQIGSTVEMDVYAKIEEEGYGFSWSFARLPKGIHYVTYHNTLGWAADGDNPTDPDNIMIMSYDGSISKPYSPGIVKIATVTFSIDDDVLPGDYDITIFTSILNPGHQTDADISATLTVQRAYAVKPMPENFGVQIVPFVAQDGDMTLSFDYKSPVDIKNISFDVELPDGMVFFDDENWDPSLVVSALTASVSAKAPTFAVTLAAGDAPQSANVKVTGLSGKTQKFVNKSVDFSSFCTITADVLTPGEDVDDFGWEGAVVEEGTNGYVKITNLSIEDMNGNKYEGGEYLASIFNGSYANTDPIVYGNYESEGARSALQTITGARTVDMTQTTGITAESAASSLEGLVGVYVQGATQSALMPKSQGTYRTVCVPFAVSGTGRYVISSVDASSITLSPAPETIPANTPFVATAGVVVGNESVYPQPTLTPETNAGAYLFKGLYQKTTINGGVYYIAQDKFWRADSDVTVAPFKAILTGSLAAKSLKIFIEDETGIREVTNQFDNEDIYNLQGMKLNKTQKGINIVGGKKVILK